VDLRDGLSVRAFVNGRPVFDNEVIGATLKHGQAILKEESDARRTAAIDRAFKDELKQIVERELIYQDALRKLTQNKQFLDKLKAGAAKDFDKKRVAQARSLKMTVEQLKRLVNAQLGKGGWESLRRQEERNYIVMQYIQSRVYPEVARVSHEDLYEYYKQHLTEFCTVDRVQWQDIFIIVGPNHPTMADARQFAEQILGAVRQGQPFEEFLRFDEGDSWSYRKGEGNGQLRGEIRPPELEAYLLKMRPGEVGPVVELSTGVHVFRVLKRDYAGQLPFNEEVQTRIGIKLKNTIADREYKRLVKELRERAVIEIIPGNPLLAAAAAASR
jgi:parvulin-like peptidyl-prolyl isomerase